MGHTQLAPVPSIKRSASCTSDQCVQMETKWPLKLHNGLSQDRSCQDNNENAQVDQKLWKDSHSNGSRPWPPSSVWNAESFVQVEVRHV